MTNKEALRFTTEQLIAKSDAAYGLKMDAYMKHKALHYGVNATNRSMIVKELKALIKSWDMDQVLELADTLYDEKEREYQHVAIDLLRWRSRSLTIHHLPVLEGFIVKKSWWDTVDMIASNLVSGVLKDQKAAQYQWVEQWIENDNIWLRRTAIIHQLKYKDQVDVPLLFALVESQKGRDEFFINKACGWALRQLSKYKPVEVSNFLELHPDLSPLTIREASKYL